MQLSYDYAKDRALMCLRANYESHLCIDRIYQLEGEFPTDIAEFVERASAEFLQLDRKTTLNQILDKYLRAEQVAIINWNKICRITHGKDPVTYKIASHILAEEIEHESWFLEILHGKQSRYMRRRYSDK